MNDDPSHSDGPLFRLPDDANVFDDLEEGVAQQGNRNDSYDFSDALERLDGDLELLKEVADIFLQVAPETMDELRTCLRRQDPTAVATVAHRLKGSLGNFDQDDCFLAALDLERAGRDGDLEGADEVYARLEANVERLLSSLRALMRSNVWTD
jgi:HPt (histidine-containing phosphotransfer) domain-containing protein